MAGGNFAVLAIVARATENYRPPCAIAPDDFLSHGAPGISDEIMLSNAGSNGQRIGLIHLGRG